jgi:16S rRNA (uracil1498-N3)-methyltransferase
VHRYFVPREDLAGDEALIRGDEYRHLTKVLRQKPGQEILVFDGLGTEYRGIITAISKEEARARVEKTAWLPRESELDLWLVQGIPKGEKMEYIIQKNTELGVKGFIPLEAGRTIVKMEESKKRLREKRWQKVALEAAKQCGRAYVPKVLKTRTLGNFFSGLEVASMVLTPWEAGGEPLKEVLRSEEGKGIPAKRLFILIGPEGGWENSEIELVTKNGGIPVTLGPRILRTETAGFAAVAAVMYQWGDLGGVS